MESDNGSFNLCWNEFEANISSFFRDLKENKDFADVTLVCADDQQLEVHKVVLAASSPFFQRILKRNAHQHPLIYMKGVTSSDLKAVMNYIYYGEANVLKANLNSFLALAEDLEVKGLVGRDESDDQQPPSQQVILSSMSSDGVSHLLGNNNDGAAGGDGADAALRLKKELLTSVKTEKEDYDPSEPGTEKQYGCGDGDPEVLDFLQDQDQEQCSQTWPTFVDHYLFSNSTFRNRLLKTPSIENGFQRLASGHFLVCGQKLAEKGVPPSPPLTDFFSVTGVFEPFPYLCRCNIEWLYDDLVL